MDEILKVIFGDYTFIQLFGFFWFLMIGYVINGLTETTGREVQSKTTPIKWNWKFWFHDNWRRYLTTILCTYILFRFYVEFVGSPLNDFEMLLMGLVGDGIGATAKKRINLVSADRKKLMETLKVEEEVNFDVKTTTDIKIDDNKG